MTHHTRQYEPQHCNSPFFLPPPLLTITSDQVLLSFYREQTDSRHTYTTLDRENTWLPGCVLSFCCIVWMLLYCGSHSVLSVRASDVSEWPRVRSWWGVTCLSIFTRPMCCVFVGFLANDFFDTANGFARKTCAISIIWSLYITFEFDEAYMLVLNVSKKCIQTALLNDSSRWINEKRNEKSRQRNILSISRNKWAISIIFYTALS